MNLSYAKFFNDTLLRFQFTPLHNFSMDKPNLTQRQLTYNARRLEKIIERTFNDNTRGFCSEWLNTLKLNITNRFPAQSASNSENKPKDKRIEILEAPEANTTSNEKPHESIQPATNDGPSPMQN